MKPINRIAAAFVAALTLFACSKEDATTPGTAGNPGQTTAYTLTATFDEAPASRVAMEDDGSTAIALKWKAGDKIYIVNGSTTSETLYRFFLKEIAPDGKRASFTCADYPAGATPAFAIHSGTVGFTSFKPTSFLHNAQFIFWSSASELPDRYPLWAKYDPTTRSLSFKPLMTLLKLRVTLPAGVSGTVSQIKVEPVVKSKTFYTSLYDFTSGSAVRARDSNYLAYNLTFTGSTPVAEGAEATFYLQFGPGTEPAGKALTLTLTVDGTAYTASVTGAALEAGRCYPLTLPASKWTKVQ